MKTNNDDFDIEKKTRLDVINQRITNAESVIEKLKLSLNEESKEEIEKIQAVINNMKSHAISLKQTDDKTIDKEIDQFRKDGILNVNNEKMKVLIENEKMKALILDKDEVIRKLQEELKSANKQIALAKEKEDELLAENSMIKDKAKNYKSKAYGYDISKKFELYQNKVDHDYNIKHSSSNRNENQNLAYSMWEKPTYKNPYKLEELSKQKDLWIGNSSNIDKLVNDIDANPIGINRSQVQGLSSNMRKYSPYIFNK